jgi:salicylate hydroxylase
MTRSRHALIAGAGIGGLTAALCLARRGWSVEVFEAASQITGIGAGLQLSPNAMHVMSALGLQTGLLDRGFEPEALELRLGHSGHRIFRIPTRASARSRWGAPYLHIHRADLIDALAQAVHATPAIRLHLGLRCSHYETLAAGARLQTGDDRWHDGDLLVGADGIHSTIRRQMAGEDTPRFTGNIAWRATVPVDRLDQPPPPTACVWAGRSRHAVTYRLRGGELANLVGIVEHDDWPGESWTEEGTRGQALADFAGWHPTVTELIGKADHHFRWALFDRRPLDRWIDGRTALLGDACHPMLPFQAQGAAQAIEDAFVLAREVSGDRALPGALQRYEDVRKPRTTRVQAASRANMKTFHRRTALAQIATYGPMWLAGHLLPGLVRSRQDWIYGHDVTATGR